MFAFTVDKNGNPGHPTRRFDMIRKLLKRGRCRIIGGGASGKPPVVIFYDREFDAEKTVDRRFVTSIDPGYRYIGYAVCEIIGDRLVVLIRGELETRTPDIRRLMDRRRMYRRQRRYLQRKRMRRKSTRVGQNLTKFKVPRYHRGGKRMSATLRHAVETHLNLFRKLRKLVLLPHHQLINVHEDNWFDMRRIAWGTTNGSEYQKSPRGKKRNESDHSYVLRHDDYRCVVCESREGISVHHLRPRKKQGSDRAENMITLCEECHLDIHAGRIFIPLRDVDNWRAASHVNGVCGILRQDTISKPVCLDSVISTRRKLNLEKSHGNDAVVVAASASGVEKVDDSECFEMNMKQYRRHNRARTHAFRDRLYKLDGQIVARNRRKKTDQEADSLSEIREKGQALIGRLKVYPGKRVSQPKRMDMPTISGDVWLFNGQRFVASGVSSKVYIYSPALRAITGRSYVSPKQCERVLRNAGMVVV